ncbi:MAG: hypothetical protein COV67_15620 [Nitrospinae bacterium CG11_big_fil_rev_8_21_14_0_20_56_8]|nr:MAG: hypothetical protein COV67_15620 [Nitrospinae bacterium CG11_big_fil_rev_8_21_14_0_20_56_8]
MPLFSKKIAPLILGMAVFFLILIPVSTSFAIQFISEETEVELGREADKQVVSQYGIYQDKELQLYVNSIGQRLISKLADPIFNPYQFKIVDSSEINAFALPGGFIYVTTGLLAVLNNESQLAGVLGHEIGHVTFHHAAKMIVRQIGSQILSLGGALASPKNAGQWLILSTTMFQTINLGYGQEAELEADSHGIMNEFEAGYDPQSMVAFLKNLRQHEILSGQNYHSFVATHPETKERIIKADMMATTVSRRAPHLIKNRSEYLSKLKGLVYQGPRDKSDTRHYDPMYIDIYEVKEGDTFSSIAKNLLNDPQADMETAVLNGMKIDDPLTPGDTVKLIRKGTLKQKQRLTVEPDHTAQAPSPPAGPPDIPREIPEEAFPQPERR